MAELVSVNVGAPRSLRVGGREVRTGIFKEPCTTRVAVNALRLAGDHVLNESVHGGPDQAVYVYRTEAYDWWRQELSGLWDDLETRPVHAGGFGENLTVSGLPDESELAVGDRLEVGTVVLEITAPRIPCNVFATKMSDKKFPQRFMEAGRCGFYCRVIETGELQVGDAVTLERHQGERLPIRRFFVEYHRPMDAATLREYLAQPIDRRSRAFFEDLLAKMPTR